MKRLSYIFILTAILSGNFSENYLYANSYKNIREDFIPTASDSNSDTLRFDVDNVPIAKKRLAEISSSNLINSKIKKQALYVPQAHQNLKLVPASGNAFIATLQECYDQHRPLALSPDVIWLAICQGVSIHINQNIESLKSKIFTKDTSTELAIRNDSLEYGEKHWQELISSFADETKKYTKDDFYSFFVSDFSTTSQIEKTAYQITLLESYKQMFTYVGETGCGIVSVSLLGEKKDWVDIYNKLDKLEEIGLGYWGDELKPIIQEFINAYDGQIHRSFWSNIYKNASEYNAFYISGWCIKFFPYIINREDVEWDASNYDEEKGGVKTPLNYQPNKYMQGDNNLLSVLSTNNFPSGLSEIEIIWLNHFKGTKKKMSVFSGFFAIKQFNDKTLIPFISWAIADKEAELYNESYEIVYNSPLMPNQYWSPHVLDNPKKLAIYDIKQFKTQEQSLDFIKGQCEEQLRNGDFEEKELKNIKVNFIVLSNGEITDIKVSNTSNTELKNKIVLLLENLSKPWFPALSSPEDALELMDPDEGIEQLNMKVNSKIEIIFFTTDDSK